MIEMMLFTLVVGMAGAVAGWFGREWYAKRIIHELEKRYRQSIENVAKNAVEVRIEKQGEMYYIYNAKTNEFLAQGDNHKEITKTLNDRFPNTFFTADKEEIEKLEYKHDSV